MTKESKQKISNIAFHVIRLSAEGTVFWLIGYLACRNGITL